MAVQERDGFDEYCHEKGLTDDTIGKLREEGVSTQNDLYELSLNHVTQPRNLRAELNLNLQQTVHLENLLKSLPQEKPRRQGPPLITRMKAGFDKSDGELRIVLFGKTGCGKSASGNTILGENFFNPLGGQMASTVECLEKCVYINGRKLMVIDTPGLMDPDRDPKEVEHEVARCLLISEPGPHVLLFVVKLWDRFTDEDMRTFSSLRALFEDHLNKYIIVLFTQEDLLAENHTTVEEELAKAKAKQVMNKKVNIHTILSKVNYRYCVFDNKTSDQDVKDKQVDDLLEKILKLVKNNEPTPYFCDPKTKRAQEAMERRVKEIMKDNPAMGRPEALALARKEIAREKTACLVGGVIGGAGGAFAIYLTTSTVLTPVGAAAGFAGAALGSRAAAKICAVM